MNGRMFIAVGDVIDIDELVASVERGRPDAATCRCTDTPLVRCTDTLPGRCTEAATCRRSDD